LGKECDGKCGGIDLQMFKGLLGLTVDYYNTNTSNMLLNVPVPHLTGYSTALMNIGKVNNRGWEIALTSQKNITKDLHSPSHSFPNSNPRFLWY